MTGVPIIISLLNYQLDSSPSITNNIGAPIKPTNVKNISRVLDSSHHELRLVHKLSVI